jgi:hypothetical protein
MWGCMPPKWVCDNHCSRTNAVPLFAASDPLSRSLSRPPSLAASLAPAALGGRATQCDWNNLYRISPQTDYIDYIII